jgi:DegV family protein with EDD domain
LANVKVVTDSTGYIPEHVVRELDITVVPLIVNTGDESFKEGTKYTNKEYYERLYSFPEWPRTSQPSAGDFVQAFRNLANQGATSIVCILISSGISGTCFAAETAKGMLPDLDVVVIDSLCSGSALGGITVEAAKAAKAGVSKEEVIRVVEFVKDNLTLMFMVDSFECLKRGGRATGVQAMLGTLLQIKPILHFNRRGVIIVFEKVRTRGKALARILDIFEEKTRTNPDPEISIMHVDAPERAAELEQMVRQRRPTVGRDIWICDLGPVIGTHIGPGTLALCFYPRP